MGGAFDPIHYGHLVTAEEAFYQFSLDKVIFMPTGTPPHKARKDMTAAEQRYLMTVSATADNDHFEVSRLEIDTKGTSYTIDTLRKLTKIYEGRAEFYFITGADAIVEILTWKEADKLGKIVKLIAATRPGYTLAEFDDLLGKLKNKPKIYLIEVPALAISSTDIRSRVKAGKPIRYLLSDSVLRYIYKKGFYK